MSDDDKKAQAAQISRMLRKEIGTAADLLIKVQQAKAGAYANRMAEVALKNGKDEDHVYWQKIAKEVEKRMAATKYD